MFYDVITNKLYSVSIFFLVDVNTNISYCVCLLVLYQGFSLFFGDNRLPFLGYGHLDTFLGKNSHVDIYPKLLDWLEKYADSSNTTGASAENMNSGGRNVDRNPTASSYSIVCLFSFNCSFYCSLHCRFHYYFRCSFHYSPQSLFYSSYYCSL